jgi:hypothetical protein
MTSNEMIALLEIYRGTFRTANNMGTINQDLDHLIRWGLIEHDMAAPGFFTTTGEGWALAQRALDLPFAVRTPS